MLFEECGSRERVVSTNFCLLMHARTQTWDGKRKLAVPRNSSKAKQSKALLVMGLAVYIYSHKLEVMELLHEHALNLWLDLVDEPN